MWRAGGCVLEGARGGRGAIKRSGGGCCSQSQFDLARSHLALTSRCLAFRNRFLDEEGAAMGAEERRRLEEATLLQRLAEEEEELRAKRRQLAQEAR